MRKVKSIYLLLIFIGSFYLSAAPSETDSVLAAVNGDPITLGEILPSVRQQELQLQSAYTGKALEQEILKVRFRSVEELIDQKLIVADFHSKNLVIPPQELEKEIDRWCSFVGFHSWTEFEERHKNSGVDLNRIRRKILHRMIVQIMRQREYILVGPPSPSDIYRRFKAEEKLLSFAGGVELALLKFDKKDQEKIKSVREELQKNPAQWDQFALSFALTPGNGGNIGLVELDKLRPEFAKAMTGIKENRIYPAVETADGVYFIKVLKFQAPRKAEFKEHAEAIRKKMEDENYRKCTAEYARRLREGAIIEYFFPVPEGVNKK